MSPATHTTQATTGRTEAQHPPMGEAAGRNKRAHRQGHSDVVAVLVHVTSPLTCVAVVCNTQMTGMALTVAWQGQFMRSGVPRLPQRDPGRTYPETQKSFLTQTRQDNTNHNGRQTLLVASRPATRLHDGRSKSRPAPSKRLLHEATSTPSYFLQHKKESLGHTTKPR